MRQKDRHEGASGQQIPKTDKSSSIPSTPSITFEKKKPESPVPDRDNAMGPDGEKGASTAEDRIFGAEELQAAWEAFIGDKKPQATDMEQLILNRELVKKDAHQVAIVLTSALEISILERFEHELVNYLRRYLQNNQLQLEKEVQATTEQTNKLYTSTDKYEYMLQQNPDLKLLKERFGLDFEY